MNKRGFTLIELMIVVAIIGILAAVAIPKFSDLVTKSRESTAKSSLGALRSALSIYYSDVQFFPGNVEVALTSSQAYIKEIPTFTIPGVTNQSNPGHISVTGVKNVAVPDDDMGGGAFAYVNTVLDTSLNVNCTHRDSRGTIWSSY